ncbi:hypothetical protein ACFWWA_13315 [Streptomyces goshikiensis]|uniref:hypothetical protein n=1 Tax=Streptomyces goshikiensis TaxID=1942 RepID=UPI0036476CD3
MLSDLKGDALYAFIQYASGEVKDPYEVLDSHRLFAVELLCEGVVTGEEVRDSVLALIRALNYKTAQRRGRPANTVISEEV